MQPRITRGSLYIFAMLCLISCAGKRKVANPSVVLDPTSTPLPIVLEPLNCSATATPSTAEIISQGGPALSSPVQFRVSANRAATVSATVSSSVSLGTFAAESSRVGVASGRFSQSGSYSLTFTMTDTLGNEAHCQAAVTVTTAQASFVAPRVVQAGLPFPVTYQYMGSPDTVGGLSIAPSDGSTATKISPNEWTVILAHPEVSYALTLTLRDPNGNSLFSVSKSTATVAQFIPVAGDIDGDGISNVGVFDPKSGFFHMKRVNSADSLSDSYQAGVTGTNLQVLLGDWDGDGFETPGFYDRISGKFLLRNFNSNLAPADIVFRYGAESSSSIALAGDWNHDGITTIGLYDPATTDFHLRNSNTAGVADIPSFRFGAAGLGYLPIVGDWNNVLDDNIGIYRPATGGVFLRNDHAGGPADITFNYGPGNLGNWYPITGRWVFGPTTVGLYRFDTGGVYLKNANSTGTADTTFLLHTVY